MICASEQSITVLDSVYDQAKEFADRGCYFLQGKELDSAVRKTVIAHPYSTQLLLVSLPTFIAKTAGADVPEKTKILVRWNPSVESLQKRWLTRNSLQSSWHVSCKDFDEAIAKAERLVKLMVATVTPALFAVNINEKC